MVRESRPARTRPLAICWTSTCGSTRPRTRQPSSVKNDTAMVKEMKEFFGNTLLAGRDAEPHLQLQDQVPGKRACAGHDQSPANAAAPCFQSRYHESGSGARRTLSNGSRGSGSATAGTGGLPLKKKQMLLKCCVLHPTRKENKIEATYWLQEIVLFALNTGMRQDEILSLEWPNADLFRKTVLVVKSKNGEKRTIPMNQKVFELLKAKARDESERTTRSSLQARRKRRSTGEIS